MPAEQAGAYDKTSPHPGFDANPGKTAQLFSSTHPYIKNAYPGAKEAVEKAVSEMENHIEERRADYHRLKQDPDYRDVQFNEKTGALKATHIGHNTEDKGIVAFGMTNPQLERGCQDVAFRLGYSFILRNEQLYRQGTKVPELSTQLDAEVDGRLMDIRSVTKGLPFYRNILQAKNR